MNIISILIDIAIVLVNKNSGTIKPLFVCTKAICGNGLRAAATYHANEGVSVE